MVGVKFCYYWWMLSGTLNISLNLILLHIFKHMTQIHPKLAPHKITFYMLYKDYILLNNNKQEFSNTFVCNIDDIGHTCKFLVLSFYGYNYIQLTIWSL